MGALLKELQSDFPDVTASKVRFLEDQGLLHPARTQSGYRKFSPEDLQRLRRVLVLQRERYLPLKVIRELSDAGQLEALADSEPQGSGDDDAGQAPSPSGRQGETSAGSSGQPDSAGAGPAATAPMAAAGDHAEPLTMRELCRQSGAGIPLVRELISFGLIHERPGGFDRHDLVIAGAARSLRDHGVEPRHLRTLRQAADREIGLVEQAIAPDVAKRTPVAARRASERAGEITQLCLSIHASLVVGRLESVQGRLSNED
ncbi:MerR family transcriptional regulator [Kocuria coralli]|uniref:MerR family transcriptional regulator n=1 Tax=Kocuria coralli TaxID=1461025 RepID=A0A5J5KXP5_9MICC|nr:MerR family transcriptional regulator [Kocuria coralli]KAA9394443.1 MerR family transcriptional regulator [Kocuria coralli]